RLVEIVDVEKDVILGRDEGAEVHQMAVAARLHRNSSHRLGGEIRRHDGGGPAQECERVERHPRIAFRDELWDPIPIALGEERNGIARKRSLQVRMRFTRCGVAKRLSLLEPFGARTRGLWHGRPSNERGRLYIMFLDRNKTPNLARQSAAAGMRPNDWKHRIRPSAALPNLTRGRHS